jgi:hypothetical protein
VEVDGPTSFDFLYLGAQLRAQSAFGCRLRWPIFRLFGIRRTFQQDTQRNARYLNGIASLAIDALNPGSTAVWQSTQTSILKVRR